MQIESFGEKALNYSKKHGNILVYRKGVDSMLKLEKQIYKSIGNRIESIRKQQHKTQKAIELIDSGTLSRIENGKIVSDRNPNFMNSSNVFAISRGLKIKPNELIYGDIKIPLIKMIVLAILTNCKDNPFMNLSYDEWLNEYWCHDLSKQNELRENKTEYEFFISRENYKFYESMNVDFHQEYETVSNLILKQILQDYEFSKYFWRHLFNYFSCLVKNEPHKYEELIERFILNKGVYSLIIYDIEGINYPNFIVAFNKFWNKVEKDYVEFFDKYIFFEDDELLKNGLKNFSDEHIHNVLASKDFIELNERLLFLAEYKDEEAILSSLNMRFEMIKKLREERQNEPIERIKKIRGLSPAEEYDKIRDILQDDFAVCFSSIYNEFFVSVKRYFDK